MNKISQITFILLVILFVGFISLANKNGASREINVQIESENNRSSNTTRSEDPDKDFCDLANWNETESPLCEWIQRNCIPESQIDYLHSFYCGPLKETKWLLWILFAVWLIGLFNLIAYTAQVHLCRALNIASTKMKLSPEVAGITLLAIGNGAPDISATYIAVSNNAYEISYGALIGAGLFINTIVMGTIIWTTTPAVDRYYYLKDSIFYIFGILVVTIYSFIGTIHIGQIASIIAIYFLYVFVTLSIEYCSCCLPLKKKLLPELYENDINIPILKEHKPKVPYLESESDLNGPNKLDLRNNRIDENIDTQPTITTQRRTLSYPFYRNWYKFKKFPIYRKIWRVINIPLLWLTHLTIPPSDEKRWNKVVVCIVPTGFFLFLLFSINLFFVKIGSFPVYAIALIVGPLLGVLFWCTSRADQVPRYHVVFIFWALVSSILWMYAIANELVALLKTVGQILEISHVFLGLTVLAWGSSLGDFFANVTLAKQGLQKMAIAGCFAAPLFNLLVGLGFSLLSKGISIFPTEFNVKIGTGAIFSVTTLFTVLLTAITTIAVCRFVMKKPLGPVLYSMYVAWLIVIVVIELIIKI